MQHETNRHSSPQRPLQAQQRNATLHELAAAIGLNAQDLRLEPLTGDASTRCYFRLRTSNFSQSWILMQLTTTAERTALYQRTYRWEQIQGILTQSQMAVPHFVDALRPFGAIILQDLGSTDVHESIVANIHLGRWHEVQAIYQQCGKIVEQLMQIDPTSFTEWDGLTFNTSKWLEELVFFYRHAVIHHYDIRLKEKDKHRFANECKELAKSLTQCSYVFTHRDLHARNLMNWQNTIWQIDFQDARLGPAGYDLVSLFFDPYIPLSFDRRKLLFHTTLQQLAHSLPQQIIASIEASWEDILLQRTLKVIGSYTYLIQHHPHGKRYSDSLEQALSLLQGCNSQKWPFLAGFLQEFLTNLKPQSTNSVLLPPHTPKKITHATAGFILAAGKGTRLKPMTDALPKPLAPILGVPILYLQIYRIAQLGIDTIFINTHHLAEQIHQMIHRYPLPGRPKIHILHEPKLLGTGGGLEQCQHALHKMDRQHILCLGSDILTTLSLAQLLVEHTQQSYPITMALKNADNPQFTPVWTHNHQVLHFGKDVQNKDFPATTYAANFTGIQVIDRKALEGIPHHQFSHIIDHYKQLLQNGTQIAAKLYRGIAWHDIGSWEGYRYAQETISMHPEYAPLMQKQYGFRQIFAGLNASND
ncbi:MAG: sugar phosphate nucleotidyltransferase [Zetaproteobacteria bacterium]|nr:sugar phosphate nucleotidyltransferase [Zetaproteobacteria bacterium]